MPVTIIAEAGVNHNGSLEMAKEMARVAKACGADIVKYQTAVPELVVSKFAQKAEYQKQTTDAAESQLEMIRAEGILRLHRHPVSLGTDRSAQRPVPWHAGTAAAQDPLGRDHEPAVSGGNGRAENAGPALHRHEQP